MVTKRTYTIASVIAGILLASNLMFSAVSVPAFAATNIDGAGASFPAILIDKWIDEYAIKRPTVVVSYSSVGSGAGITQISSELVEFGASDAPMSDAERAAAPGILHFPETAGGVVVIHNNPDLAPTDLRLTGKVVADIFEGKIRFWDDAKIKGIQTPTVAAKLHHDEIITVHRSDSSGTTFVFTEYLAKVSTSWATNVGFGKTVPWPDDPPITLAGPQNPGVAELVASNEFSIGYVELSFALENDLAMSKLKNKSNAWITPSLSSLSAAVKRYVANNPLPEGDESWKGVSMTNGPGLSSYPVTSFSYLLFYEEGKDNAAIGTLTKAKELKKFVYWAGTSGQAFSADLSYVPLPSAVKTNNAETLKMMTWNGALLPPPPS